MSSSLKPKGVWWSADDLPATATGLRPVRIISGDRLRSYTAVETNGGPAVIAVTLNRAFVCGSAIDDEGSYALIDLIDSEWNIVGEIGVADSRAFQRLKKRLGLRVESTDGDPDTHTSLDQEDDRG